MKFRAKIVDAACLNHFTRVSSMVAKLAKACTLRISPRRLNFILADKVANGGVSMWCELEQENFFNEFQMEGVSAENNAIYLELTSENLSRALKTAQNARTLKIKLTNKHFPCLTVSIELVSIYLPVLKTMKSVVERMKNISNHLIIEANRNGDLNLKIESELVCVTTHFKDLGNPPFASEDASQDRNPAHMVEVHVDIRKFLQFLSGQQVNPTKAICTTHLPRHPCPLAVPDEGSLPGSSKAGFLLATEITRNGPLSDSCQADAQPPVSTAEEEEGPECT
ncbi:checkpoint protein HUS1 isoform X4 [Rhinolophus sinicus]|uniref:checkpoint protein HUS1 isoform X4 n=1 Tax=Rhinolophus sinicus TaxID=89399 RepID=UPI003D7B3DAE